MEPRLAVRAIVEREKGKILLLKRADDVCKGMYNLPGGKVDPGKSLEEALIAELSQEIGLRFEESDLTYFGYKEAINPDDGVLWGIHYFYTQINNQDKIILNEESSEYSFFNKDYIDKLELAFKPDKEVIEEFYSRAL